MAGECDSCPGPPPPQFLLPPPPRPPFMETQADCVADPASYQDAQCSFFLSEEEGALTDGFLASSVMIITSTVAMLILAAVVSVMFIWKYRRKLLCKPSVQEPCDANADVVYDDLTDFRRRQIPLQLQEIPHDSSPESTVFVSSHYQQPPDHYNQVYKGESQSSGESCADSDDDNSLSDHTYKSLQFLEQANPDWAVLPSAPMDESRVRYQPSAPPRQEIYCTIDSDSGFSQNTGSGKGKGRRR